jgi:excisionase family DNA binding protein
LGLSRNTAYARATDGTLPTIRFGRRLLVPKAALDRLLGGEAA